MNLRYRAVLSKMESYLLAWAIMVACFMWRCFKRHCSEQRSFEQRCFELWFRVALLPVALFRVALFQAELFWAALFQTVVLKGAPSFCTGLSHTMERGFPHHAFPHHAFQYRTIQKVNAKHTLTLIQQKLYYSCLAAAGVKWIWRPSQTVGQTREMHLLGNPPHHPHPTTLTRVVLL